jgi:hypothetical protein
MAASLRELQLAGFTKEAGIEYRAVRRSTDS